jgi:hypothetical protein
VATGSIVTLAFDSTLDLLIIQRKFIETSKAVTARFPFYGENDADVSKKVHSIGWVLATLVDDIQMGDFATQCVSERDG